MGMRIAHLIETATTGLLMSTEFCTRLDKSSARLA